MPPDRFFLSRPAETSLAFASDGVAGNVRAVHVAEDLPVVRAPGPVPGPRQPRWSDDMAHCSVAVVVLWSASLRWSLGSGKLWLWLFRGLLEF